MVRLTRHMDLHKTPSTPLLHKANPKDTHHGSTSQPCPLLQKLPLEIRLQIYSYLYCDMTAHIVRGFTAARGRECSVRDKTGFDQVFALGATCRQLRLETTEIVWSTMQLSFTTSSCLLKVLPRLSPSFGEFVRTIVLGTVDMASLEASVETFRGFPRLEQIEIHIPSHLHRPLILDQLETVDHWYTALNNHPSHASPPAKTSFIGLTLPGWHKQPQIEHKEHRPIKVLVIDTKRVRSFRLWEAWHYQFDYHFLYRTGVPVGDNCRVIEEGLEGRWSLFELKGKEKQLEDQVLGVTKMSGWGTRLKSAAWRGGLLK